MHKGRFLSAVIVACAAAPAILGGNRAQTFRTATRELEFEVLTVRASQPGTRESWGWRSDRVFIDNASVEALVFEAYRVRPWEMAGAPEWVSRDRYDVEGKLRDSPGPFAAGERAEAMKAILAQRFEMRGHFEQRDWPIDLLGLWRDRQLGPRLRRYDFDCLAYVAADPGANLQVPQPSNGAKPCGIEPGPGQILSGGMAMTALASRLSDLLEAVVVDNTGLDGYYELTLRYPPSTKAADVRARDAMQSALQEQLGLTLEPARRKLQVLVIDRIRRPALDVSEREGKR